MIFDTKKEIERMKKNEEAFEEADNNPENTFELFNPMEVLRKEDRFACQICNNYICSWGNYRCPHFNYIKSLEKIIKALEIIKKKGIDTDTFRLFHDYEDYEEYGELYSSFANRYEHYTQEEYELLKEILL